MPPSDFKLQYSRKDIAREISKMASSITKWAEAAAKDTGRDPIAVPVLRGAMFFLTDLIREVGCSIEVAPVTALAYDPTTNLPNAEGSVSINLKGLDAKGRSILIVDDICDTGRTLAVLSDALSVEGANEVKAAVLICRDRDTEKRLYEPQWAGFHYPGPEWFVGYGMDDKERWRNLPEVYTLSSSSS